MKNTTMKKKLNITVIVSEDDPDECSFYCPFFDRDHHNFPGCRLFGDLITNKAKAGETFRDTACKEMTCNNFEVKLK